MDDSYQLFSELNSEIETSNQKMLNINEKEEMLKWTKTDFDKLVALKDEFDPYYKLITLHKNYRLNVLSLFDEPFSTLNYGSLDANLKNSIQTLKNLLE